MRFIRSAARTMLATLFCPCSGSGTTSPPSTTPPPPSTGGGQPTNIPPAAAGSLNANGVYVAANPEYGMTAQLFGVGNTDQQLDLIKNAGFNWVALQMPWKVMEPQPGYFDKLVELRNVHPNFVQALHQQQVTRLAQMTTSP